MVYEDTFFTTKKDWDHGEPMEFEWKNFPVGILDEIQKLMTESKYETEHFKGRTTLIVENEEREKIVLRTLTELVSMLEDSREDIGHFQGLDRRRNGTELMSANLMDNGTKLLRT